MLPAVVLFPFDALRNSVAYFPTRLWYLQSFLGRPRIIDFGTGLYFLQSF